MKAIGRVSFQLLVLLTVTWNCLGQADQSSARATAPADELSVYAAIVDSFKESGKEYRPLIADKTSTFSCDADPGNGLSIGGCNGLKSTGETAAERMSIVKRDIPALQPSTIADFEQQNQEYGSINAKIPTTSGYYLYNDSNIPKTWKYTHLIYLSRVGFNAEHTQALINVGLFSAADAKASKGSYVILENVSGKWVPGNSSAVWQLSQ